MILPHAHLEMITMEKLTEMSIDNLNILCGYTDQELQIKLKANGGLKIDLVPMLVPKHIRDKINSVVLK